MAATGLLGVEGALVAAVLHNVGTLAVMANAGRLLRFDEIGPTVADSRSGLAMLPATSANEL